MLRSKGIEACKKRKQHSLVLKSSGITGQAEKITSLESLRLWLGSFQHILRWCYTENKDSKHQAVDIDYILPRSIRTSSYWRNERCCASVPGPPKQNKFGGASVPMTILTKAVMMLLSWKYPHVALPRASCTYWHLYCSPVNDAWCPRTEFTC